MPPTPKSASSSDGTLLMLSGGADLGTGLDTITAKAAAEILGLDMEDVEVISGDTDVTPFDKGAYASSGTYFSGNAALIAAQDLREKVLVRGRGGARASRHRSSRSRIAEESSERRARLSLAQLAHMSIQGEGHHELSGYRLISRPSTPPSPTAPTSSRRL
jgi:putative selenate reductase molybdopterin-binding subunit